MSKRVWNVELEEGSDTQRCVGYERKLGDGKGLKAVGITGRVTL